MKRRLTCIALATTILIGTGMTAAAGPPPNAPCRDRAWIPRTGMPAAEAHWRVIRLVSCATERWWPGHAREVLGILWRESRYDPFATNPADGSACWGGVYGACGLGQHLMRYWPGRALEYLRAEWFRAWPASWHNARANVIVTVRQMAAQGSVCPAWC